MDNFLGDKVIGECCSETLYRRLLCEKDLAFTALQEMKGKEAEHFKPKGWKMLTTQWT